MHVTFRYDARFHRPSSRAAAGECSQHGIDSCKETPIFPSWTATIDGNPDANVLSANWSRAARSRRRRRPDEGLTKDINVASARLRSRARHEFRAKTGLPIRYWEES